MEAGICMDDVIACRENVERRCPELGLRQLCCDSVTYLPQRGSRIDGIIDDEDALGYGKRLEECDPACCMAAMDAGMQLDLAQMRAQPLRNPPQERCQVLFQPPALAFGTDADERTAARRRDGLPDGQAATRDEDDEVWLPWSKLASELQAGGAQACERVFSVFHENPLS